MGKALFKMAISIDASFSKIRCGYENWRTDSLKKHTSGHQIQIFVPQIQIF